MRGGGASISRSAGLKSATVRINRGGGHRSRDSDPQWKAGRVNANLTWNLSVFGFSLSYNCCKREMGSCGTVKRKVDKCEMNKGIKTIAVLLAGFALTAGTAAAAPHHGGRHAPAPMHRGGFHHPPPMHHGWHHHPPYRHYHGGYWGSGGRYFWPGFVGGVVGGVVGTTLVRPYYTDTVVVQPATTVVTTPTVVTQPAVIQQPVVVQQPVQRTQNVWVEGRYVDQVQTNGSTVRVWQPGHYEQQTVVVQ